MERTNNNKLSQQIKRHARKKPEGKVSHIKPEDLVPMGSTLLNLAMSGSIHGGAKKGTMVNIIGASHGAKTLLVLTTFAEVNKKKSFGDYALIYDEPEHANAFDMEYMFGSETAERVVSARAEKEDEASETVQHFHANVKHWIKKDIPFIYVLDSFDALDALEDQKKADQMAKDLEEDKKDSAGTYGMAKAKAASSILRNVTSGLSKSQSTLFIVSQTRDNVDPRSFSKQTRSGGRALKFYASHEMWLTPVASIKRKETIIGNTIKIKISKNKLTGKNREIEFDAYYDYGIDDIGSCIDYLLKMKRWGGGGKAKINTGDDFEFETCTRPKLIGLIESNNYHRKLQRIVEKVWNGFEDSLKLGRKRKYE